MEGTEMRMVKTEMFRDEAKLYGHSEFFYQAI